MNSPAREKIESMLDRADLEATALYLSRLAQEREAEDTKELINFALRKILSQRIWD